ncbi:MAG TPA: TIGR04063 family PEP-CTERM/XrtA system glycosyltransferase [Rhodanobacteraceae bacterium]|nr:TIGR04063 family PEP-CTERM/XrtA system glycosyltransferase [Rhodanobacteraceae bacterium]
MNDTAVLAVREPASRAPANRPLHILHVLDQSIPVHSGYTFRTLAILRQQRAQGWQTYQLTSPKQGGGVEREERVDEWLFYRTPAATGIPARLPLLEYRYLMKALRDRLAEVVASVRPDILHAHSPVLDAFPALEVGRAAGIPVVYEVRAFWEDAAVDHGTAREWGPRYRLTRAMETRALRQADAVTTICDGLRGDILRRGISADKVTVIPNAVDVSRFPFKAAADQELMRQYGLTPGATLGFAGSFYAYEGLDSLLQVMPLVLRVAPQVRLLLVGGGPQDASLRATAARLGIEDVVHFVGRVPHHDVQRYCSVMDVMVFPRVPRRLTELVTPLKPLEAMAMGKLVAASDVGGHRELIRDGYNGHLFRTGSPDELAKCLVGLLDKSTDSEPIIANARAFVERERTWATSVARYRDVYAAAREHRRHRAGDSHAR